MNVGDYVGIPFAEKGASRAGANCWGLVRLIYEEQLGIELPGYEEFFEDTLDESIPAIVAAHMERSESWRPVEDEEPGDVVVLRVKGLPWHVGVVCGGGRMIHVELNTDSVWESYRCNKWEKRILGFYRHTSRRMT